MANFRTIEVTAFSAKEAMINGPFAAYAIGANCTQAWKKAGCPTEPGLLNEFMEEQLEKKTKFGSGVGLYIVLEPGYKNKSNRPYKYTNKQIPSYQRWHKSYLLVDDNNKIIREVNNNRKSEAVKAAREEYANGFQGNLNIRMIKSPVEEDLVVKFEYKPSKGTQLGKYLLFGTVGPLE